MKRPSKEENLSAWYLDVVEKAQLADYAPVKGCMVIRPYGYAIWENIQRIMDGRIRASGAQAAYFPLFIPQSFLAKEKEHVEGFSPECAVVTHGGGEKLEEPLFVRPTSETIMYYMFARWVQSWRDLPLKINQWCNVVRWEKRTFPFLRTLEFLWQEGHTAHATQEEAVEEVERALKTYRGFFEEVLALPVFTGRKTENEKFAGAVFTLSCEAQMPDGKALQVATSHMLGQNFSRPEAFNIAFQDREEKLSHVWQTSWGMSTRVVGAIIMSHGDDRGLVLPPAVAPIQVILVPIWKSDAERSRVAENAEVLLKTLRADKEMRVESDFRTEYTPGWKFNEWELRGVPLRLELGPRDVEKKQVVLVRRDTGEKKGCPQEGLSERLRAALGEVQDGLYQKALRWRDEHTRQAIDLGELEKEMEKNRGFFYAPWCGQGDCEMKVKEVTRATARCISGVEKSIPGKCLVCGSAAKSRPVWAQAY